MAFVIHQDESIRDGIERLLQQEQHRIIEHLADYEHRHEAVHEARKSHKKIRALLRLVRPQIGEEVFQQRNVFYRDNARLLSDLRDASALLEALAELKQCSDPPLPARSIHSLQRVLHQHQNLAGSRLRQEVHLMKVAHDRMEAFTEENGPLPMYKAQFTLIQKGLVKIYQQGREGLGLSLRNPSMENLHAWRKKTKYLWYVNTLLSPIWPEILYPFATEIKLLSEKLGFWRDLGLLAEFTTEHVDYISQEHSQEIFARINSHREQLQKECFGLGFRLYREKPSCYIHRIKGYWKRWQNEGSARERLSPSLHE